LVSCKIKNDKRFVVLNDKDSDSVCFWQKKWNFLFFHAEKKMFSLSEGFKNNPKNT